MTINQLQALRHKPVKSSVTSVGEQEATRIVLVMAIDSDGCAFDSWRGGRVRNDCGGIHSEEL